MARTDGYGSLLLLTLALAASAYFAFSAVQGDLGVLERLRIEADIASLEREKAALASDVAVLKSKTRRLSDSFLDLDLLDERARDILGMMRIDEITPR